MKTSHCLFRIAGALYVMVIGATGCSGEAPSGGCTTSDGGISSCASGGSPSGGTTSTNGGAPEFGGSATAAGSSAVGGSAPEGGVSGTGGASPTGGAFGMGGLAPTGGGPATSGGATSGGTTNFQTCQLVPQSGCPGQACDLDLTHLTLAGTVCRPVTTAGIELSACTGMNDCAAGYLCLNSECVRYCQTDANCVAPGGLCVTTLYADGTTPIPGVTLCSQNCDLLTTTGCRSGQGCGVYSTADGLRRYTSCHAASTGTQGATCTNDLDCAPGFGCINFTTNGTTTVQCMQLCQPTVTVCPGSTSCVAFNPPVTLGATSYGICH